MDIVIGGISPHKKNPSEENVPLPAGKKGVKGNRRKRKHDRRRSVREGIFVSLSTKDDRRFLRDRRRAVS
jgi:hypothetical protein